MSKSAIVDELHSVAVSVSAAIEGAENGDWMKVELALFEVQDRTARLLREVGIVKGPHLSSQSGPDE